jgi:hypothetical protein
LAKSTWTPGWHLQNRKPAFINNQGTVTFGGTKYLWGNVPAFDLLHLEGNEGIDYAKELNLLFAGE